MNQTGRFPMTSRQGNICIIIMYDNDTNVINVTAIKSTLKDNLIPGYGKLYNDLKKADVTSVMYRLDNKASKRLLKTMEKKNV